MEGLGHLSQQAGAKPENFPWGDKSDLIEGRSGVAMHAPVILYDNKITSQPCCFLVVLCFWYVTDIDCKN